MFLGLVESVEAICVGESSLSSVLSHLRSSSLSFFMEISLQSLICHKVLVLMTVLNNIMS